METEFRITLTSEDIIFIEFSNDRGNVEDFAVKLVCVIDGQRYEVVRHDSAHDCPHKDILDVPGRIEHKRKLWYDYLNNNQALTLAIADIKENHEFYRERFIKWLKQNQQ